MRFLIACDKFKGTLDAASVNQALAAGIQTVASAAEIRSLSVADGGQGFLQAVAQRRKLELRERACHDALGRPRPGRIGWNAAQKAAYIESADAIGLPWLTPAERNPWRAQSAGLGELISAACALRPTRIYVGLGGSATCDGGIGCLGALGWRFADEQGLLLPARPAALAHVSALIPPAAPTEAALTLICDVENPPLGPRGGVRVYSPQKGADAAMVAKLEAGMSNWVRVFESWSGRRDLAGLKHGGAAGCLGLALSQALGGELRSGADWLLGELGFAAALAWADVVVTGEGAFDASSRQGKITGMILERARTAGKASVIVSGQCVAAEGPTYSLQARNSHAQDSPELSLELLRAIGAEIAEDVNSRA